jgi:hypothetical protein
MAWVLQGNKNEGYPTNTGFPNGYVHWWTKPKPWTWKINREINDGYPYRYVWFPTDTDDGTFYYNGINLQKCYYKNK